MSRATDVGDAAYNARTYPYLDDPAGADCGHPGCPSEVILAAVADDPQVREELVRAVADALSDDDYISTVDTDLAMTAVDAVLAYLRGDDPDRTT